MSTYNSTVYDVEILTLTLLTTSVFGGLPYLGPAFDLASEEIRVLYPYLNVTQKALYDASYTTCATWATETDNIAAREVLGSAARSANHLTVFLQGGCTEISTLVPLAAEMDTLIITSVVSTPTIQDRRISPTWISTSPLAFSPYDRMYVGMARNFSWTTVAIIYDTTLNPVFATSALRVQRSLRTELGIQVATYPVDASKFVDYTSLLRKLSMVTRICLFFGPSSGLRNMALGMVALGMHGGDYVVVSFQSIQLTKNLISPWQRHDGNDEKARIGFRSIVFVELDLSIYGEKDTAHFEKEMATRSATKYNYTYGTDRVIGLEVSPYPAATYLAMMALAQVVAEAVTANDTLTLASGRKLAQKFMNRTFETGIGSLRMNNVGERITPIFLSQLDWNASTKRVLLQLDPKSASLILVNEPQWNGAWPVRSVPPCGFSACISSSGHPELIGGLAGGAVAIAVLTVTLGFAIRWRYRPNALLDPWWVVHNGDIVVLDNRLHKGNRELQSVPHIFDQPEIEDHGRRALYKEQPVWISPVKSTFCATVLSPRVFPKPFLHQITLLKQVDSEHLNRFLGVASTESGRLGFVSVFCDRGSLWNLLEIMTLDVDFQLSLLQDVVQALKYIHRSKIRCHGRLNSWCFLIDQYFIGKIGRTGFGALENSLARQAVRAQAAAEEYWVAPELLQDPAMEPSPPSDVYALGGILHHIATQHDPRTDVVKGQGLLRRISEDPQDKPANSPAKILIALEKVVMGCRKEQPNERLTITELSSRINLALMSQGRRADTKLVEKILQRLERYAEDLDEQVYQRTVLLMEEKRRSDLLLREILPSHIVENMKKGLVTNPESFDSVTIMFSEINGFSDLVTTENAASLLQQLDKVYVGFDGVLSRFSVYKVETIKDTYLVVSGLPERIGDFYIREVCGLSRAFMKTFQLFDVASQTCLRVGVNSGPCVAGVVGHKSPRYCLFGDAINTASRMMSYGENFRVHLSESSANLLQVYPDYKVEERGLIEMKGKGVVRTFWLMCS